YIFFINPNIGKGPFSIYFSLKNRSNVDISIYNTLGQKISDIYKGVKEAGNHVIKYDGNLNSGIYFIILKTSENSGSYRIIKVK
ncbi:MAG: T9SS type A sorting domain-containing protein, partial [candidate division WOR-3 bacterium]